MTTSAQEYLDRFRRTSGDITDFSNNGNVYDGSITDSMPREKVDTSESDRAVASASQGGGTGIASDSGLGGADFVNYYSNLGESDNDETYKYLDKFQDRSNQRVEQNRVVNASALDRNIERSIQNSYDKAAIGQTMLFGDFMNPNYQPPKWENSAPKEVERPDMEGIYKDILKNIK